MIKKFEAIDLNIVQLFHNGDESQFEKIYRHYKHYIYTLAVYAIRDKDLARDIVQAIFIAVLQKIETLSKPENFHIWLHHISYEECCKYLKKAQSILTIEGLDEGEDETPSETSLLFGTNIGEFMKEIILKQDFRLRSIGFFVYYSGFTERETAGMLGLSLLNVKGRLHKLNQIVSNALKAKGISEDKLKNAQQSSLFPLLYRYIVAERYMISDTDDQILVEIKIAMRRKSRQERSFQLVLPVASILLLVGMVWWIMNDRVEVEALNFVQQQDASVDLEPPGVKVLYQDRSVLRLEIKDQSTVNFSGIRYFINNQLEKVEINESQSQLELRILPHSTALLEIPDIHGNVKRIVLSSP
ncbi:hypothetical protein FACS189418_1570 [Clostridia bacterium]|nr:hypothetical protein FACS189418_1570 [Clostridia bacterium]